MKIRTFYLVCLLLPMPALAEDASVAGLFSQHGVKGTIVISSLKSGKTIIHDDLRAATQFSPASTFKVFNTLISLEERAISGKDEVLKWDGHVYEFPDWNRDQTLETAFRVSCVWCYQAMARKVGAEKYKTYITQADYGELTMPFELTTFWLDGSLKVSAMEQVALLKKIYQRDLPFSLASYETLRDIMRVEQTATFTLWAKTGWAARLSPQIGWYVGYVETKEDVWFFAANINIRDGNDLPLRQKMTREALRIKAIID